MICSLSLSESPRGGRGASSRKAFKESAAREQNALTANV